MVEKKKRVSIGLTETQFDLVDKLAKEKGFSKSAIFVLALEEYARKESEQKKSARTRVFNRVRVFAIGVSDKVIIANGKRKS